MHRPGGEGLPRMGTRAPIRPACWWAIQPCDHSPRRAWSSGRYRSSGTLEYAVWRRGRASSCLVGDCPASSGLAVGCWLLTVTPHCSAGHPGYIRGGGDRPHCCRGGRWTCSRPRPGFALTRSVAFLPEAAPAPAGLVRRQPALVRGFLAAGSWRRGGPPGAGRSRRGPRRLRRTAATRGPRAIRRRRLPWRRSVPPPGRASPLVSASRPSLPGYPAPAGRWWAPGRGNGPPGERPGRANAERRG